MVVLAGISQIFANLVSESVRKLVEAYLAVALGAFRLVIHPPGGSRIKADFSRRAPSLAPVIRREFP